MAWEPQAFQAGGAEKMHKIGVIHGRFQVLHNDHMKYLMAGKARCSHLVIGITNPDPTRTKVDPADPARSDPVANPLTYFERYTILKRALLDEGLGVEEFSLVPLPINFPDLYRYYVPMDAVFFLTIYDKWGERKLQMFKDLGLKTEVLWQRDKAHKGISATEIRKRIIKGMEWRHMVPGAVAHYLDEIDIVSRLRELASPGK